MSTVSTAVTVNPNTPKIRTCSRCGGNVALMINPRAQRFEVAHLTDAEPIWRCPKSPILNDEPKTSSRRKAMTDAQGNTIRDSRYQLLNLPATSLFRWMGANGFNFTQVAAYVDFAGIKIPVQTIKRHMIDGASGDGKKAKSGRTIPALSDDQVKELMNFKNTSPPAEPAADTKKSKKKTAKAATKKAAPKAAAPAKTAPKKASKK